MAPSRENADPAEQEEPFADHLRHGNPLAYPAEEQTTVRVIEILG
jgi:hypothetical protein